MKTSGIIILVAFLLVSTNLIAQWERVSQFNLGVDTLVMNDIYFKDVDTGFAVLTNSGFVSSMGGRIIKTEDGGQSWDTLRTFQDTIPMTITFTSENIGYIFCRIPPMTEMGILKTINGGVNWAYISEIVTGNVYEQDIYFYNDNVGIYSFLGYTAITYDGGFNWSQLNNVGNPSLNVLNNFVLMASGNGFVYSYDTLSTYGITSFLSNASINNQDVNIIQGDTMLFVTASGNSGPSFGYPYFNYGVIGIHDLNSGESGVHHFPYQYNRCITRTDNYIYSGAYDTENGTHRFLKSEDGGYTWWSQQIIEPETPSTLGVRKIVCLNDTVCYGMDGSYLYKTTNGGGPLIEMKGLHYSNVEENRIGNDDLNIYPNPTSDVVQIQSNQKVEQIKVLDFSGKVLLTVNNGYSFIDVSHLGNGIYLLQLKMENGTVVRKFVKE